MRVSDGSDGGSCGQAIVKCCVFFGRWLTGVSDKCLTCYPFRLDHVFLLVGLFIRLPAGLSHRQVTTVKSVELEVNDYYLMSCVWASRLSV